MVVFIANFDDVYRVKRMVIDWWIAPNLFGMLMSNEPNKWWPEIPDSQITTVQNSGNFMGNRPAFPHPIEIEPPKYTKSI